MFHVMDILKFLEEVDYQQFQFLLELNYLVKLQKEELKLLEDFVNLLHETIYCKCIVRIKI